MELVSYLWNGDCLSLDRTLVGEAEDRIEKCRVASTGDDKEPVGVTDDRKAA
jgi:hypothetical protein